MQAEPPLWIGHPFGFDARVAGAKEGDVFSLRFARATGQPEIEVEWSGPADEDGTVRVRILGSATAELKPGASYRAELALRRGAMSGILGTLFVVTAQRALAPPIAEAAQPLVNAVNKPLRLAIVEQAAHPVQLVAGLKGDNGAAGDAFDFVQATPAAQWTVAHNLGRKPSVTTLSTGGVPMEGAIVHLSIDVCRIDFLIPVAGSAHLV